MAGLRQRKLRGMGGKGDGTDETLSAMNGERHEKSTLQQFESGLLSKLAFALVLVLAFYTRFYMLAAPGEVVFDEVHFVRRPGFLGIFLQLIRNAFIGKICFLWTYFFDVHPPMAKILLAFMGWFIGYDGHFMFDSIGMSYSENKVPYVGLRSLPACFGALTVIIIYLIMKKSGYSVAACVLASGLILFDNAHVGQTRLILLDATLELSMVCSIYSYICFFRQRHNPYSSEWWKWLLITGFALSFVISTKYVGVFTFVTIGFAVAADLWNLLDIKRGLSLLQVAQHVLARATALIVFPFIIYLFWFYLHFQILKNSGPGDDFMSPDFQKTLQGSVMLTNTIDLHYFDDAYIQHRTTKAYLHSHQDTYPLRYDDGRVSSEGQQVTASTLLDYNSVWKIIPSGPLDVTPADIKVRNGDVIKLRHVSTSTDLLTHDVAAPLTPTNEEFTTISLKDSYGERQDDTEFIIELMHGDNNDRSVIQTHSGLFKLIHKPTRVAMWTSPKQLPEWGYHQQEVNGNKNLLSSENSWTFCEIVSQLGEERGLHQKLEPIKIPFWRKYIETQRLMFQHNNALTSSHPYASQPVSWPFLTRGVSFWTQDGLKRQIYLLGNPIGWWICALCLAMFTGVVAADQLACRRGLTPIDKASRSKLYNSIGFFFVAWAAHYLPFYLMGRQLFLHHYLPAHIASAMLTGALSQFFFTKGCNSKNQHSRLLFYYIFTGVFLAILVLTFVYFAPMTYGTRGMEPAEVNARKWLNSWDFHFAEEASIDGRDTQKLT